jgi:hypothetical protein
MKSNLNWIKAILLVTVLVFLADMNIAWYRHPLNNVPVLKYTIIILSVLLFVVIVLNIINRTKRKK